MISNTTTPVTLKSLNSFKLDSVCPAIYFIRKESDLRPFFGWAEDSFYILGEGSNVLMLPQISKPILKIEIKGIEIIHDVDDEIIVRIGAGENWHQLVLWTLENGYFGLENLSLIPGTVGAAPIQNIGAYGAELQECFVRCECMHIPDGKQISINKKAANFGYRDSIFKHELKGKIVITHVHLKLSRKPNLKLEYGDISQILTNKGIQNPSPLDVSQTVIEIRNNKLPDPKILGNAGSFFKNPVIEQNQYSKLKSNYPNVPAFHLDENLVKIPAAWLIQESGWKAHRKGDAGIHEKQALVLVNYGRATGRDLIALADEIRASVFQKFNVLLENEVQIWT